MTRISLSGSSKRGTALRGRPFPKGKSGNPGGRPRDLAGLRELARLHAPGAIAELARLATKARSEATRIAAIRELLDRGYGKPSFDSKVALEIPIRDGDDGHTGGQVITIEMVRAPKRED
jgi:hypothetical protein